MAALLLAGLGQGLLAYEVAPDWVAGVLFAAALLPAALAWGKTPLSVVSPAGAAAPRAAPVGYSPRPAGRSRGVGGHRQQHLYLVGGGPVGGQRRPVAPRLGCPAGQGMAGGWGRGPDAPPLPSCLPLP